VRLEARALVFNQDGQVLLCEDDPEGRGELLPGGLTPAGAAPLEGLKAALERQTGWRAFETLRLQSIHQTPKSSGADHVLVFRLILTDRSAAAAPGGGFVWRSGAEAGRRAKEAGSAWVVGDLETGMRRLLIEAAGSGGLASSSL
jgi:ADP-ribose pyrophosphatase YjhB (NUDIX family)